MPSPYLPPFEAPLLKSSWGHKLTMNLSAILDEYKAVATAEMKPDPHSDPRPDVDYYRMAFDPPMPTEIPFLLGDAIHNLRASLDIMMCDVAELRGKQRTYKFPFAQDEARLRNIVKKDFLKLGEDVADQIFDLRPHSGEGGNEKLRALHDLDIMDKHRIIIPFFGAASKANPAFGAEGLSIQINANMTFYETQRLQVRKDLGPPIPMKFDKIEDPYLPDLAGPFSTKPLVPVLLDLHTIVLGVIDSFAALFGLKRTA